MGRTLACGVAGVLFFLAQAIGATDPAAQAEGKRAFSAGVNLLQDPDGARYEDALIQFRRAYELLANWKILGNIGICALKLERDGEAIEAFEKYLADGGKQIDKAERAQVERDLTTLRASVVPVHIDTVVPGIRLTDERQTHKGQRIVNEYYVAGHGLDVGLHAGHHVIVARATGAEEKWEAEFSPGNAMSHTFFAKPIQSAAASPPASPATPLPEAPPPSPPVEPPPSVAQPPTPPEAKAGAPSPQPAPAPAPAPEAPKAAEAEGGISTTVYALGGTTLVLAASTVVTGVLALSKRNEYADINGQPGHTRQEIESAHDSAQSMALINTVLFAATAAGAGATAAFFFARPTSNTTPPQGMRMTPWVATSGLGVSLGGAL